MATNREKKERRRGNASAKKRARIRYIAGGALLALLTGAVAGVFLYQRAERMGEVYIDLAPIESGVAAELAVLIEGWVTESGTAERSDLEEPEEPQQTSSRRDTPTLHVWEGEARGGADLAVVPSSHRSSSANAVAIDPYVAIYDRRAVEYPPNTTLDDFAMLLAEARLEEAGGERSIPFVVAGDERDFAALSLYLAGELLTPRAYRDLLREITDSRTAPEEEEIESMLETFVPVVELLSRWRDAGLIATNWTDWDYGAVDDAIIAGRGAIYLLPRSHFKSLDWDTRFHLRVGRLPIGPGRLSFRLVGGRYIVESAAGPRRDARQYVVEMFRASAFQEAIEDRSSLTPVALETTPLNRTHRDLVSWYRNAEEYVLFDEQIANHPVFERLHAQLR